MRVSLFFLLFRIAICVFVCLLHYNYSSNLDVARFVTRGLMKSWGYNAVEKFASAPVEGEFGWNVWKGKFPGTIEGCHCASHKMPSMFMRRDGVSVGLHAHTCSYNETHDGCDQVPPIPAKNLTVLPDTGVIYFKEIPKSSFFDLYKNMEPSGECKKGTFRCGDPQSLGGGFCVPENWKICPVSRVWISSEKDDQVDVKPENKVTLKDGKYLAFTSNSAEPPINEFKIAESHVCLNPSLKANTKDRDRYKLDAAKSGKCKIDPRYKVLDSAIEKQLLELNNLRNVLRLPIYETDPSHLWMRFYRSPIPWSPKCQDLVPTIRGLYKALKWFSKWSNMMYWTTLVGTVLLVILNWAIYRAIVDNDGIDVRKKWMNIRGIIIVVVAALYIYEFYNSKHVLEMLERVNSGNCGDSYVKFGFVQAWRAVKSSRFFYALWTLLFITNYVEGSWNRMRARSFRREVLDYLPDRTQDSIQELAKFFALL